MPDIWHGIKISTVAINLTVWFDIHVAIDDGLHSISIRQSCASSRGPA